MDYSSEDIRDLIASLDRMANRFGGMSGGRDDREALTSRQKFDKSVHAATQSIDLMHGSAREASSALHMLRGSAIGVAFVEFIHGLTGMSTVYGKLTNVGQMFGGSMFEMQKQAADSNLTLEQFADQIAKSSVVVAQLSADQSQGVTDFTKYQSGVRTSLANLGYFGMTLSQLNDISGDYAETLRLTGQWGAMDKRQREQATSDFLVNIQQMAAATGKTREELMKIVNQSSREPLTAAMVSQLNDRQQKAYRSMSAGLAAFPQLHQMMDQLVAKQGRFWDTSFGKAAQHVGLGPDIAQPMMNLYDKMMSGVEFSPDDLRTIESMKNKLGPAIKQLSLLSSTPGFEGDASEIAKFFNDLQGFKADEAIQRMIAPLKPPDDVTRAMELFETSFNNITSAFRQGLYGGVLSIFTSSDSTTRLNDFKESLITVQSALKDLGETVGVVAGYLLDVLPVAVRVFDSMVWGIQKFHDIIKSILGIFGNDKAAEIGSALGTVGAIAVILLKLKRALTMNTRVVNLYAETVVPHGGTPVELGESRRTTPAGGVVRGQSELALEGGRAPAAAAANAKTGIKGWFSRNFGAKFEFGSSIVGMVTGLIAGALVNSAIDSMDKDDSGLKDNIEAVTNFALSTAGFVYGPMIARGILTAITEGVTGDVLMALGTLVGGGLVAGGAIAAGVAVALGALAYGAGKGLDKNTDENTKSGVYIDPMTGTVTELTPGAASKPGGGKDMTDERGDPRRRAPPAPGRPDALVAPVTDSDSKESLQSRFQALQDMRTADESESSQTPELLKEIKNIIAKQSEITNALLHKGNTIAKDAADADKRSTNVHSL